MSQLPYRQSANVKRRTWDREAYEAKAKQQQTPSAAATDACFSAAQPPSKRPRTGDDNDDDDGEGKEEFRPAAPSAAKAHNSKRALLQPRQHRVTDIDSKVGKVELVSAEQVATSKSAVVDDNAVSHKVRTLLVCFWLSPTLNARLASILSFHTHTFLLNHLRRNDSFQV